MLTKDESIKLAIYEMKLQRKAMIKRGITRRKAKPGRGRPAKGYDQIKKEWIR